jgi:hypothetical protein
MGSIPTSDGQGPEHGRAGPWAGPAVHGAFASWSPGDQINKNILGPLAKANPDQLSQADFADFNDANKLGSGKSKASRTPPPTCAAAFPSATSMHSDATMPRSKPI